MTSNSNTCVLISSCDKYYDLWDPFFHFFEKHWSNCPYPVYLATNHKAYQRKNIRQVFSGINSTWSDETLVVLKQLPYEYIIYLQDDYFILKPVDQPAIDRLLKKMMLYKATHLRLFPAPGPDSIFNDDELGSISQGALYRTSLQGAIWQKETFISLLDKKEDQWQFEVNGGQRSAKYLFLSLKPQRGNFKYHTYPISYYYLTAVIRGKFRYEAASICREEGVRLDLSYRPVESYREAIYRKIYEVMPLLIKKVLDLLSGKIINLKKRQQ